MIEIVGGLALLAALVVAVGAWRLSQGPMSIEFLRPYAVEALHDAMSPVSLDIEDTFLAWAGWGQPLSIRAVGVRLLQREEGGQIAAIPEASIGISLRALARGMLAPTRIELIGPRATAIRDADGKLSLRLGAHESPSDGAVDALVASLLTPPDRNSTFGYLTRVSISNAQLHIEDRASGQSWVAPAASVLFSRNEYGVRVDASLDVDLGSTVGHVDGEAEYRVANRTSKAVVWFADLSPARVAERFPMLKPLAALAAPVTGYVAATLDPEFNVTGGEIELAAKDGRVEMPGLWPNGLSLKKASVKGRFTRGPDRFTIAELKGDVGAATISFSGTGTRLADAIAIGGEIDAASNSIDAWDAIWPKGFAVGAREWITANLEHGSVPEMHANLALRLPDDANEPPRIESVAGTFRVEDTTVHYLRPLLPVTKASGRGTFDAERITIKLIGGTLKRLRVDGGTIDFTKLDRRPSHVTVDVNVRGPLRDPLEVLDSPRFRYMQKLGIDPAAVEGEAATRLVIALPTINDIPMSSISLRVASNLEGVEIRNAILSRDLTDGRLELKLDNDGMDVSGTAKVAGLPSEIVWVENFDPKNPIARRYRLKTRMDEAARSALGLDLAPYLTGSTPVEMAFSQPSRGPSELQVRVSLDDATLVLDDLDWKKPPGQAGTASVVASLEGNKLKAIPYLSVAAPNLEIEAQASFGPDGKTPSRIDISRLKAGANDLKGSMMRHSDGGWTVDLSGSSLNASRIVHPDKDEKEAPQHAKPPLTVNLDVGRAWFRSATPIEHLKGQLVYDGSEWSSGALDATLPKGKSLSLRLVPQEGAAGLSLTSDDAGETLRQFGIYDDFLGGRLNLEATRSSDAEGPWKGKMTISDFRAVKAPALAKLLTVASLTGISSILSGQGIYFARLDMPFTFQDEVLTLEKGRMVGSELGLTGDGEIDLANAKAKVTGTIVPAYTINSLLGNIPLLGPLFTGSQGSGIFAATYKIEGPFDDVSVSVNPLAMLAPGFLRALIDGISSGEIQQGEELPQPDYPN